MSAEDLLLECRIDDAFDAVLAAETDEQLTAAWQHMRELLSVRSPEQIARMEESQGLR